MKCWVNGEWMEAEGGRTTEILDVRTVIEDAFPDWYAHGPHGDPAPARAIPVAEDRS